VVVFVAQRVREVLHRCWTRDLVPGDVQGAVDLRKGQRAAGAHEDTERGVTQVLAVERVCR
jgi:hypothetical protein